MIDNLQFLQEWGKNIVIRNNCLVDIWTVVDETKYKEINLSSWQKF
jgi:hypothetical protein